MTSLPLMYSTAILDQVNLFQAIPQQINGTTAKKGNRGPSHTTIDYHRLLIDAIDYSSMTHRSLIDYLLLTKDAFLAFLYHLFVAFFLVSLKLTIRRDAKC